MNSMYVDTESRWESAEGIVFDGVRGSTIEDFQEISECPSDGKHYFTTSTTEIYENSVVMIRYTEKEQADPVYEPYYVHMENDGLVICESCEKPEKLIVQGKDGTSHLTQPELYDEIMDKLVGKDGYEIAIKRYPLSVLNLTNSKHQSYISTTYYSISDNWLIDQLSKPELIRYLI